jgi:hypothetical protein
MVMTDLTYKQSTADYSLTEEERLLLGFMAARGSRRPVKTVQKFSDVRKDKIRIAEILYKIRHWQIICEDYRNIPGIFLTKLQLGSSTPRTNMPEKPDITSLNVEKKLIIRN